MSIDAENDVPPLLIGSVDTPASPINSLGDQLDELAIVKVPITIVTASDIEKALTINNDGQQVEEWLELANGCICCSVKDSGVNAIESLMERRGAFDYILLETTGLADPGNIAPLFWVDEGLGSTIYLDGIVTLVDAKNVLLSLNEQPKKEAGKDDGHQEPTLTTAHFQISHADVLVINKADLVSEEQLEQVKLRLQAINGLARIHVTRHGQVPLLEGVLLDLHAYDKVGSLEVATSHSHIDPTMSTITILLPILDSTQISSLDAWLRSVLWESTLPSSSSLAKDEAATKSQGFEIHRLKGRIFLSDGSSKLIQGVREVFEIIDVDGSDSRREEVDSLVQGKMVLIGRGLGDLPWEVSLKRCLGAHRG